MLALSQERGATSAFRPDAVPPCGAAPSIILDEGPRLSRSTQGFFRAVRVFLSGLVDRSAFQKVSLGREVSSIFTSMGPIITGWRRITANNRKPRAVKLINFYGLVTATTT